MSQIVLIIFAVKIKDKYWMKIKYTDSFWIISNFILQQLYILTIQSLIEIWMNSNYIIRRLIETLHNFLFKNYPKLIQNEIRLRKEKWKVDKQETEMKKTGNRLKLNEKETSQVI